MGRLERNEERKKSIPRMRMSRISNKKQMTYIKNGYILKIEKGKKESYSEVENFQRNEIDFPPQTSLLSHHLSQWRTLSLKAL